MVRLMARGWHRGVGDLTHSQTGDVLEILLPGEGTGTFARQLHIIQAGDADSDWNIAAQSHPTLYIHSVTTPITDYLRIGGHDGTRAYIEVVGGLHLEVLANLIIDQAAQDVQALSLQSSDVATGLTTIVQGPDVVTDDFFTVGKLVGATGGAYLQALAESSVAEAMYLDAWGGAPSTVDTSTSRGMMNFFVGQHDGSNSDTDMLANSNAIVMGEIDSASVRQTRFLLKADDGELHLGAASSQVALDEEDDVMLIRAFQRQTSSGLGLVETPYDNNPFYDQDKLRALGIVSEKGSDGHSLFRLQPLLGLHEGAMWQLFNDMMQIAEALPEESKAKLSGRMQQRLTPEA